jgi:site-specific recombinase XerD
MCPHAIIPLFDDLLIDDMPASTHALLGKLAIPNALADYQKMRQFLKQYNGSNATFNSYRREIERFTQWLWLVAKKSLTQIKRSDIEDYLYFCQAPPKTWIGTTHVPRFILKNGQALPNPTWKPFVATVSKKEHADGKEPKPGDYIFSQTAIRSVFAIISSLYNYLMDEGYVEINPVMLIRQKSKFIRKQQTQKQIRRLSTTQWNYVITTAEDLADNNPEKHERTLFIMSALYSMYLRISELTASMRWTPQMGHFRRDNNRLWWFTTVGKGNKERDISVSDTMLNTLKRYRRSLNLTELPSIGEQYPLIPKMVGKGAVTDTRLIRRIVQFCFDEAANRLRAKNLFEEADQLMSATVHWLRHTGISDDVKIRPREHVRDDAGHSSGAITDKYIDIERKERHASARKKLMKRREK